MSTDADRRTGFDRIYDCRAGREILDRTRRQPARPRSTDPDTIDWRSQLEQGQVRDDCN